MRGFCERLGRVGLWGLWSLAALPLLGGCASTVEDVCETIAEECRPIDESACRRDGLDLEEVAENVDCEPAFEDHLDCLDEAVCDWETRCTGTLDDLQSCVTRL